MRLRLQCCAVLGFRFRAWVLGLGGGSGAFVVFGAGTLRVPKLAYCSRILRKVSTVLIAFGRNPLQPPHPRKEWLHSDAGGRVFAKVGSVCHWSVVLSVDLRGKGATR